MSKLLPWQKVVIRRVVDDSESADGAPNAWPEWSAEGVPLCESRCPYHDGKRCQLLGERPGRVCEPTVMAMASALSEF